MESSRGMNENLWGQPFDNSIWNAVTHLGQRFYFSAGTIIKHNTYCGIFFIKRGRVCISHFSDKGKETKALYYGNNSIFNEARTFSVMNPEGSFVCVEDCEIYFFPRSLFKDTTFLRDNPQLVQNLLSTMADKILLHYYALTELRADTDIVSVSKFIYDLYKKSGGLTSFKISYSQQDIADILGMHRTSVARAIRRLREEGALLQASHYTIVINDITILKEFSRRQM